MTSWGDPGSLPYTAYTKAPMIASGPKLAHNAPRFLITPTYEGSGQAAHPDVLYDSQEQWYWMVMTPLPQEQPTFENPSILVSTDGNNWLPPVGLENPIDKPTAATWTGAPVGHNSDPDLVLIPSPREFVCFWRWTDQVEREIIYYSCSSDGIKWSHKVPLFRSQRLKRSMLSPSVVYRFGRWEMWYVSAVTSCHQLYHRYSHNLARGWSDAQACTLPRPDWLEPWHADVIYDSKDEVYVALLQNRRGLFLAKSRNGTLWNLPSSVPVLEPSERGWDASLIYRSTLLRRRDDYDCWYSARGLDGSFHIGRTSIPLIA